MSLTHSTTQTIYHELCSMYSHEKEYLQTVFLFLNTIDPYIDEFPEYFETSLLRRFIQPDRIIAFKITWVDDQHQIQVNHGYRVQHNNTLGPYKGGIRFHPSVNQSICKFLAFDQTLKNALTNTMIGGAKGGSDFDPKGKSEMEIMRFSQAFALALHPYIGADWDIPAGDIGVGYKELGYMVGMSKTLRQAIDGTWTGKHEHIAGSFVRKEAAGFGLCYIAEKALKEFKACSLQGLKVVISGSGNVAIYAAVKAIELGACVVAMSDSSGFIYDPQGIDITCVQKLKEASKQRLKDYLKTHTHATYHPKPASIWTIACDVAFPCATQNELNEEDANTLIKNGVLMIGEGANMPCSPQAIHVIQKHNLLYLPGIASNAGGVAVSALEMSQNASKRQWSYEEVDAQLKHIMDNIYTNITTTAQNLHQSHNLVLGAQLAGYFKVVDAIKVFGVN